MKTRSCSAKVVTDNADSAAKCSVHIENFPEDVSHSTTESEQNDDESWTATNSCVQEDDIISVVTIIPNPKDKDTSRIVAEINCAHKNYYKAVDDGTEEEQHAALAVYQEKRLELKINQHEKRFGPSVIGVPWKQSTSKNPPKRKSESEQTGDRKSEGISSNGLGVDHCGVSKKYVESSKSKRSYCQEIKELTSRPLMYLLQIFGKKHQPHFFFDSIHVVNVMCAEFGYDMVTLLGCRWFNAKMCRSPPGFKVEYQRAVECLDEHLKENAPLTDTSYRNFSSIVDKMYTEFKNPCILNNYNKDQKQWLCQAMDADSFKQKVNTMTEYIHIATICIMEIFPELAMDIAMVRSTVVKIFAHCTKMKEMDHVLYNISCVYHSRTTISTCQKRKKFLDEVDGFAHYVSLANERSRQPERHSEILKSLERTIITMFREVGTGVSDGKKRANEKNKLSWVLTRYRIVKNFIKNAQKSPPDRSRRIKRRRVQRISENAVNGCCDEVDEEEPDEFEESAKSKKSLKRAPINGQTDDCHDEQDPYEFDPSNNANQKDKSKRSVTRLARKKIDYGDTEIDIEHDISEKSLSRHSKKIASDEQYVSDQKQGRKNQKKSVNFGFKGVNIGDAKHINQSSQIPNESTIDEEMCIPIFDFDNICNEQCAIVPTSPGDLPPGKNDEMLVRDKVEKTKSLNQQWDQTIESMSTSFTDRTLIGTAVSRGRSNPDIYFSNLEQRFGEMHWARMEDIHRFNPTLYCKNSHYNTILRCAPVEMYLAMDLYVTSHSFKCIVPGTDGDDLIASSLQVVRHSDYVASPNLIASRVHWDPFQTTFHDVVIDFGRIFLFVLESNSDTDNIRDTTSAMDKYSIRFEIGVSGLNFNRRVSDEKAAPYAGVVGQARLDDHKEGPAIRRDLGKLIDASVELMDIMKRDSDHNIYPFFGCEYRNKHYAKHLADYLEAKTCRVEWLTIQIKCLDRGDVTNEHVDKRNCRWPGYNVTGALSFIFMDSFGIFWSLKFITNSRKVIGDYYIPGMLQLYTSINGQIAAIDNSYYKLTNIYGEKWPHLGAPFCAKNFRLMFLDDFMPWVAQDIGNGVQVEMFTLIAAPQRDLCLSLLVSGLRCVSERTPQLLTRDLLKFIVLFSYQNSFLRTFHVIQKYAPQSHDDYYNLLVREFGSFKGGPFIRFSASGLDIERFYLDVDQGGPGRLDTVIDNFLVLIQWINESTMVEDSGKDQSRKVITVEQLREAVEKFCLNLELKFAAQKKPEISHFRTLLMLQICALSGIALKQHPILTKLVYVAEGTGGYKWIHQKGIQYGMSTDLIMSTLGIAIDLNPQDIGNGMEALACESQKKRLINGVNDVFVKGQDLFTLDCEGRQLRKKYGSRKWETCLNNHST